MKLSVAIIVQDEERRIRDCLESVRWADEILVLDSGSSDGTLAICREYTQQVHVNRDWQGFGVQKNRVLALCSGDWVLSLDADERVSPELAEEIQACMTNDQYQVWEIPRLSSYCGRFMRHGGWWPDPVARLFRRGLARFSEDLIHERLLFRGRAGRLRHPLIHLSFEDPAQVLDKLNRYSSIGALRLYQAGRRSSPLGALLRGCWAFVRTWLLRGGLLDGQQGLMLAISNAEGVYYKYLKLWHLQRQGSASPLRKGTEPGP